MFRIKVTNPKSSGAFKRIRGEVGRLGRSYVTVGTHRDAGRYANGALVGLVAFWLEYGTVRMPARPFLGPGLLENVGPLREAAALAGAGVTFGHLPPDKALASLGAVALGFVKSKVLSNVGPALSGSYDPPSGYLGQKKKADATDHTLIFSGLLYRSLAWRVARGDGSFLESPVDSALPPGAAGQAVREASGRKSGKAAMQDEIAAIKAQRAAFKAAAPKPAGKAQLGKSSRAANAKRGQYVKKGPKK